MAQGVEPKQTREYDRGRPKPTERSYRPRTWFTNRDGKHSNDDTRSPYSKPPCAVCGGNHGVWSCKVFSGLSVPDRWGVAKEKHLCFRCLVSNHVGKDCTRSKPCAVQGCKRSHHNLLHEVVPKEKEEGEKSALTREGAETRTHTSRNKSVSTAEVLSLRTIPVWLKANGRKVKVNAILDDASNETFLNEQVAGVLGLHEPYKTVKVHVLNNEVETFQSMPVE
ncbi:Hypothetical predicted protein [Paramuricea clavata]|uniref:Uncharacterized protein n=1 Tax=Paramuricea clavata TaxID=317549 RepID=A0A7D9I3K9_PARCT|nr:Hypothetical predicted protein [Paramuricea clavata]